MPEFCEPELDEPELDELELDELDELELEPDEGVLELDELDEGVLDVEPPSTTVALPSPSPSPSPPTAVDVAIPPFESKMTETTETALLVMIVKRSAILRMIAITFISEFFIGKIPLSPYRPTWTV